MVRCVHLCGHLFSTFNCLGLNVLQKDYESRNKSLILKSLPLIYNKLEFKNIPHRRSGFMLSSFITPVLQTIKWWL